jgi:hypothetical protein
MDGLDWYLRCFNFLFPREAVIDIRKIYYILSDHTDRLDV